MLKRQLTGAHSIPVNGKEGVSCETIYIGNTSCRGGTLDISLRAGSVKMAFTWVYLDEAGKPVADLPKEAVIAEFTTRPEAEIWLTTNWKLLLNGGVHQVSLWDGTELAMENMSLHPA